MKKRITSLLLALVMALTLLPAAAFAEDEPQTVTPTPAQEQTDIPTDPADPETPELPETSAEPEQPAEPEPPAQPEETPEPEETPQKPEIPDDLEVSETDEGLSVQYFDPQIDELREKDGFKLVNTYSQLSQCLLYGYNARLTNNVDSDTEETNRYKMLTIRPLNGSTEITLDLNGCSITYKGVEAQECLFDLRNNDTPFTFRVIDSVGSGKVYCTNSPGAFYDNNTIFYIQLGNKLRIEGGEFVQQTNSNSSTIIQVAEPNGSAAAAAANSADITITGGKFQNRFNARLIHTNENQTGRIVNVALCGGEFIYYAKTRYGASTSYPVAPILLKNTKLFTAGATMTANAPDPDRLHCYLDFYNDACKTLTLCGTHPALSNYKETSYVPAAVGSKRTETTTIGSSKNSYVEYVHPLITCPALNITDIDRKEGWAKVFFEDKLNNSDEDISRAALKCPGRANRGDTITLKLEGLPDGIKASDVTWECYIGSEYVHLGSGLTRDYTLNETGTYVFWAYVNKGQENQEMKDQFRVIVKESQKVIDTVDIQLTRPVDTKDIAEDILPDRNLSEGIAELTFSSNWYQPSGSTARRREIVLCAKDGYTFADEVEVTLNKGVSVVGSPSRSSNDGKNFLTFTIEVTPAQLLTNVSGTIVNLVAGNRASNIKIRSGESDKYSITAYALYEFTPAVKLSSTAVIKAQYTPIDGIDYKLKADTKYILFVSVIPQEGYAFRASGTGNTVTLRLANQDLTFSKYIYNRAVEDTRPAPNYTYCMSFNPPTTGEVTILGDLNDDGKRNISDMQALYQYLTHGDRTNIKIELSSCDLNGDGGLDVYDLQYLYELVNKMRTA